ncbi:MAG: hypothetical protein LAO08_20065 [Acidobacteriia bacterium]|nr:hypothetical protein [Terriglobia bacterium]
MKKTFKRFNVFIGLLVALIYCSTPARAQFLGYASPQTVAVTPIPSLTCNGTPVTSAIGVIPNSGQNIHFLSWNITGGAISSASIFLQGSFSTGGTPQTISDMGTSTSSGVLQVSGYYPIVQVVANCTGGGTMAVFYSGTSVSGSLLPGPMDQTGFSRNLATGPTLGSNFGGSFNIPTPYGSLAGTLVMIPQGGAIPANSSITITPQVSSVGVSSSFTFPLAATTNVQFFSMPAQVATAFTWSYTSGGASPNSFTLFYEFNKPGFSPSPSAATLTAGLNLGPSLTEKGARWSVVSNPAVSTQASASKAAGAAGVRHVADCISVTAGASTAPTATSLVINLRDGASGAGTVLWSVDVNAAATAANHGAYNFCGLNLIGSPATAMTLEFAALLTNEFESVTLTGYDVQ